MNQPTIITSMLIPRSDGRMTHPVAAYLAHFEHLVATGLPIVVYLAPSLAGSVRASNVTVIPTSLEDLPLWRDMQEKSCAFRRTGIRSRTPPTTSP